MVRKCNASFGAPRAPPGLHAFVGAGSVAHLVCLAMCRGFVAAGVSDKPRDGRPAGLM